MRLKQSTSCENSRPTRIAALSAESNFDRHPKNLASITIPTLGPAPIYNDASPTPCELNSRIPSASNLLSHAVQKWTIKIIDQNSSRAGVPSKNSTPSPPCPELPAPRSKRSLHRGPVSRVLWASRLAPRRRRPFLYDDDCSPPLAAYPGVVTSRTDSAPCLALHRVGFTEPGESPRLLVRSYRTVSPLPLASSRG